MCVCFVVSAQYFGVVAAKETEMIDYSWDISSE